MKGSLQVCVFFKSFRFSHFYEEMMSHDILLTGGENATEKDEVNQRFIFVFFISNRALLHFWLKLTNSHHKLVLVCHPQKHMLGANLACRAVVRRGKLSARKVARGHHSAVWKAEYTCLHWC